MAVTYKQQIDFFAWVGVLFAVMAICVRLHMAWMAPPSDLEKCVQALREVLQNATQPANASLPADSSIVDTVIWGLTAVEGSVEGLFI
uniref:TMhelix containing protein n=1 Tax=Steinernema glaseri TaxID=37863 RepID=A0A1I8AN76_9BILA